MEFYRRYLIFGGAGSLGRTLVKRLQHCPVTIFSRDEAKHYSLQQDFPEVKSIIGNVRDYESVLSAIRDVYPDVIVNCSALKQVPACEYHPYEAVQTNIVGTHNIVKAVESLCCSIGGGTVRKKKILSISTDKACKPVNSYGMTKALQERIHLNGKYGIYNCVRYGNVLESTGSVIPVFKKLIEKKKALTVTHIDMTRFLLSLDQAVNLIFTALGDNEGGKIFIPKVPAAKIIDLANCLMPPNSKLSPEITGIRPGEKLDEILVSEEELMRTEDKGDVFVIHDIKSDKRFYDLKEEYSSKSDVMTFKQLEVFLGEHGVL